MAPSLALTYSSRGRDGLAGVGWTLGGLSEIRRIPKSLAADRSTDGVDFDGLDTYGLDGARLVRLGPTPDGGVEYRTEPDQVAKVVAYTGPGGPAVNPERFRVYTKGGLIRDYGPLFATRRAVDPDTGEESTTQVAATWVLREERDRSGNFGGATNGA